ncbi:PadR family transcriptional regulator [Streptomyces sp. NPDC056656]|uniref:PadR family transcriptional regulator n=1 Tax=Streptomyces sp. NPDC056656 TaxID=3345895 RepID=UPI0036991ABF
MDDRGTRPARLPDQPRGTLYPTRHRLEADGLLSSEQQVVDGRTCRVYRATKAGKEALAEDRRALRELAREVLGNEIS